MYMRKQLLKDMVNICHYFLRIIPIILKLKNSIYYFLISLKI